MSTARAAAGGVPLAESPLAIREYFRCLNEEDHEAFARLWHADAELVAVGTRTRRGRDDVLTYYRAALGPWPTHHDEPTRILPCGSAVTVEIHFSGATAAGRPVEFDAVDVFDLDGGGASILRLSTWYDIDKVRKLLAEASA